MRRVISLSLICLLCLAAPALAKAPPSITVQGRATLELAPEIGRITVGVQTRANTAAQAAQANAKDMAKVRAALKAKLGPGDSLESAGYWLRRVTRWNKEQKKNEIIGYEASHRLEVSSRDPKALGALLDAAVGAGANSVDGPRWDLADPAAAQRKALAAAFVDAKARAQALAQAAGRPLGPVLKIKAGPSDRPAPLAAMRMAKNEAASELTPGLVQVSAEVTCVFALGGQAPQQGK
ncbi:MAG: SIMPL domain-containing protein [Desulfarculaceae bacterium]|nr:SIMPL domain-containing protein [Desulfarculaceae bacterium]MCF8071004.1 SIMPL domain-containing protein [Desulfarculaceae bacterium]MCF8100592.1 SIMPL domain-containing protein [Desulfarculaceae bacterium]MCF8117724.1 SIMPL domain-containing protein [Desulfarculaceae bacterium]